MNCAHKARDRCTAASDRSSPKCTFQIFFFWGGLSGSEDRAGGDNSIQFINFERVGDKSFKEWRQKIRRWKGG